MKFFKKYRIKLQETGEKYIENDYWESNSIYPLVTVFGKTTILYNNFCIHWVLLAFKYFYQNKNN